MINRAKAYQAILISAKTIADAHGLLRSRVTQHFTGRLLAHQ